jgi:nitrite reductase/ring-hydroxylating ferredoxin subunit
MSSGTKIANVKDIPEGKGVALLLEGGEEIALFKVQGKIYALQNGCPHMGGPLGEGDVENGCVVCPWHGYQFDVATGSCIHDSSYAAIPVGIEVCGDEVFLR